MYCNIVEQESRGSSEEPGTHGLTKPGDARLFTKKGRKRRLKNMAQSTLKITRMPIDTMQRVYLKIH